ncbi:MAG: MFS transporter [Candidatus Zixiibacteriota bacterium]
MNQRYKMFTVAGLGAFLATFESSSINVALPSLSSHFGSNIDSVSWVVLIYTQTIGPTLLLFAAWARKVGVKFIYLTGFSLFAAGSLICGLSNSFELLLAGRVVQGLGASMNMALGPAVITHAFPKGERGKGMGFVAMVVGAGLLLGPLLGGYLVTLDWRYIFLAPLALAWVPFAIVPGIDDWRENQRREEKVNLFSGAVFFVFLASFLYGMKSLNNPDLTQSVLYLLFGLSAVCGVFFVMRERREHSKLIGAEMFSNRNFTVSVALVFLVFVATSSIFVLVPFFVERELGFSPREAGLFLAVAPVLILLLSPVSGRIADRIGARAPTIVGLLIVTVGAFMLRGVTPDGGVWGLLTPLIVFGVGMGVYGTPNSSDMMGSAPEDKREIASGLLATMRTLSITFGVALSAALFVFWSDDASAGSPEVISAYNKVFTISVAAASLALIVSFFRHPGRR